MKTISILLAILGTAALAIYAEQPPAPVPAKKAEEIKDVKEVKEAKPPSTIDAKETAAIAAKLNDSIQGSPEKLAKEAQRLVRQVQAELEYGKPIAVLDARIRLLEEFRVECRLHAEEAIKERKTTAKELEEELARLKMQYKDNPEIAEQAQVELVVSYRITLRALKAEEDHCLKQATETTRHLLALRMTKAQLEEKRKLDVKGLLRFQDLALPPLPSISESAKAPPNPTGRRETLKDALDSIKYLIK